MGNLSPVIDDQLLQEKINQSALKGALSAIDDFYTSYNSPYKKLISEELEKTPIKVNFGLPDIVSRINETLSSEIDKIANTAVSKTFLPMVQEFLTRVESEIKFSEILVKFIEYSEYEGNYDLSVEIQKNEKYDWLDVTLTSPNRTYQLTLHSDYKSKKLGVEKFIILSLPYDRGSRYQTMKISIEGGTFVELPFTPNVLTDSFVSYISRLVMCGSLITMDVSDFEDWMFPEDECSCH